MNRALVIYGDRRIGGAIADGMAVRELAQVRSEIRRLNAVNGVRAEGDARRWERTKRRLARKYTTAPVGKVHGAILGAWALVWLTALGWIEYFQRWNREA